MRKNGNISKIITSILGIVASLIMILPQIQTLNLFSIKIILILIFAIILIILFNVFKKNHDIRSLLKERGKIPILDSCFKYQNLNIYQCTKDLKKNNKVKEKYIICKLLKKKHKIVVIYGDAGFGKTTLLKYLYSTIAKKSSKKIAPLIIPYLLYLSEYNHLEEDFNINKIEKNIYFVKDKTLRHLFFLDGFNEITYSNLEIVINTIERIFKKDNFSIVISTRPALFNYKFSTLFRSMEKFYYVIENWDKNQVSKYLLSQGIPRKKSIKMPEKTLKFFQTPFIAYLFISRIENKILVNSITIFKIIEDYIENIINPSFLEEKPEGYQNYNVNTIYRTVTSGQKLKVLSKLAYVNNNNTLIFSIEILTQILKELLLNTDIINDFILEMHNSGLFLSIDKESYKYRHQILQEYLCSKWVICNREFLPENISSNQFWRDIPQYMFEYFNINEQEIFINNFIEKKDFLTATKLVKHFKGSNVKKIRKKIAAKIISSIERFDSDEKLDEVLNILKDEAEEILIQRIRDADCSIIAPEEYPIGIKFTKEEEQELDSKWRSLGRAISSLTYINSNKAIGVLFEKVSLINSNHLKYHILEYIITTNTHFFFTDVSKNMKIVKIIKIMWVTTDPIISTYSLLIFFKIFKLPFVIVRKRMWNRLFEFIKCKSDLTNSLYYLRNFWNRNHGIECLSIILTKKNYIIYEKLIIDILEKEEKFKYSNSKPFYHAIFKSILKSVYYIEKNKIGYDIIFKKICYSYRISKSDWALKFIDSIFKEMDRIRLEELAKDKNINFRINGLVKHHIDYFKSIDVN